MTSTFPETHPWDAEAIERTAARLHASMDQDGPIPNRTKEAASQVWGHIYAYLRGRIPDPVPFDVENVAASAGLRIAKGIAEVGTLVVRQGEYSDMVEYKSWAGFLAVERMTLDRYRQRTA